MKLEFFDANAFVGRPAKSVYGAAQDAPALLAAMDKAGVSRALVWHIAQHGSSPEAGNGLASEAVSGSDRLFGCWAILPPVTREIDTGTIFDDMKRNRVSALRVFPLQGNFLLNRVVFGAFLDEVAERRVPLLVSPDWGVTWQGIYDLMKEYPKLTCVVCDVGVWGMDRQTWPLLDAYPNLRLETSLLSLQAGGVEETVRRFGAERLVFGTGFPLRYPEAPMLQLAHADISDSDRSKIACGNMDAMVAGVML